jgi:hypoxanthine phosphoribosyltransferase
VIPATDEDGWTEHRRATAVEPEVGPRPLFAHASEAEMARILDFYAVRWEYEPHTFPILWNLDGMVVESFSPDFWLPDLDLYLEITTLRQRLVRKKNRKLRRLRELYPDLRVKLFYARDFRALMLKYGKYALVPSLSGTPGQVASTRHTGTPMSPADPLVLPPVAAERGASPVGPTLAGQEGSVAADASDGAAAAGGHDVEATERRTGAAAARRRRGARRSARVAALTAERDGAAS